MAGPPVRRFEIPWPYSWALLGHTAFFRYFTVTFRAADFEFEVQPNKQ